MTFSLNIKTAEDKAEAERIATEERNLSPKQFAWMLAYTGLDDVWDALEAQMKNADRAAYAEIRSQRTSSTFILADTLAMVDAYRTEAEAAAPGADLSDVAIKDAWRRALPSSNGAASAAKDDATVTGGIPRAEFVAALAGVGITANGEDFPDRVRRESDAVAALGLSLAELNFIFKGA